MVLEMLSSAPSRLRRSFTDRQLKTLLAFAVAEVCQAICVSLQAPFYPKEAEARHATASEYGMVFGVFELVVFLACPVIGPRLKWLGAKRTFHVGIFITGSCAVLFGLLDFVHDRHWFIWLSVAVRAVEAVGNSCFLTAAFSIVALEFPDRVGSMFAVLETFFGLGLIIGPTVGGALYQAAGYILPFALLGGFLVFASIATVFILPKALEEGPTRNSQGYLTALRIPQVFLATFSILCASSSIGFLLTALEPHLRVFELKPFYMGLMFVLNGGSYALSAPFWGALCDRPNVPPLLVNGVGAALILIAFLLLGPAPFLPMSNTLFSCTASLFLHGVGIGAVLVSSFSASQRGALAYGFVDGMETYGMISGLWSSIFALGAFVGPTAAGLLMDWFKDPPASDGIPWATQFITVFCAAHLAMLGAYAALTGYFRTSVRDRGGYQEIGGSDYDDDDDSVVAGATSLVANGVNGHCRVVVPNGRSNGIGANNGVSPATAASAPTAMPTSRRGRVVAHNRLSHPRSPAGLLGGVHGWAYVKSPEDAHEHHPVLGHNASSNGVPVTSSHLDIPHDYHELPHEIPEELSSSTPLQRQQPTRGAVAVNAKRKKSRRKSFPAPAVAADGASPSSSSSAATSAGQDDDNKP